MHVTVKPEMKAMSGTADAAGCGMLASVMKLNFNCSFLLQVLAAQQVAAQISAQAAAAKASGAVTMTAGSQAQSNALAIAQPGPALNNPLVAAAQAVASQLASQVWLSSSWLFCCTCPVPVMICKRTLGRKPTH